MTRLIEILAERSASKSSAQADVQQPITDNHVAVAENQSYSFAPPLTEFQALFVDCEDF